MSEFGVICNDLLWHSGHLGDLVKYTCCFIERCPQVVNLHEELKHTCIWGILITEVSFKRGSTVVPPHLHTHTHTHTHTHRHTHTCTHTHRHTHMHTHTHTHMHNTHIQAHSCMHSCTHPHAYVHALAYTCACMYAYLHMPMDYAHVYHIPVVSGHCREKV